MSDIGEKKNVHKVLMRISENKALGRRRSAWASKYLKRS
jgi:hypothetical protein